MTRRKALLTDISNWSYHVCTLSPNFLKRDSNCNKISCPIRYKSPLNLSQRGNRKQYQFSPNNSGPTPGKHGITKNSQLLQLTINKVKTLKF
ncbi:hypothetical protein BON23_5333 [Saccharomyces cerevisiae]|nr:hypothetical protein BON23_5333 [Saccharomyces cerevisiae]